MNRRKVEIIFGPPGTGKTTRCVESVAKALRYLEPSEVMLLTFSRAAAREARERLARDAGFQPEDLLNVRTLHSLAYGRTGISRNKLLSKRHWDEIADGTGLTFREVEGDLSTLPPPEGGTLGDRCLRIIGLAKARRQSLEDAWRSEDELDIGLESVVALDEYVRRFKAQRGLLDFHDLLETDRRALERVKLLILDEGQDLTPAQWIYVRRLAAQVPHIIIAGDDDQAIYEWAGADPVGMLRFRGDVTVLPQSRRLPRAVVELARTITADIATRQAKEFTPRDGDTGRVDWLGGTEDSDLHEGGTWLLLARHRYQLAGLEREARRQGVPYQLDHVWSTQDPIIKAIIAYERLRRGGVVSLIEAREVMALASRPMPDSLTDKISWDALGLPQDRPTWLTGLPAMDPRDREYVRDLRRRGYELGQPGHVRISTVHGAKGWEADNVLLLTDTSRRSRLLSDAERRVAYVAVTRSRNLLAMVRPTQPHHWEL